MPMKPELLLVDDDPSAIQALSQMLSGEARMRFACSGAEALRLASASRPDLMLLDAEMPGMSGMQVLLAVNADPLLAGLPVMVVTSHRDPETEAAFFDSGAVDFLPKPLVAAQVLARVRAQLRLQRVADVAKRLSPGYLQEKKSCILVVDDDVNAIQLLRATLLPMVDQIKFATDGAAALRMMLDWVPDLVLLDVQMPGLDGISV